MRILFLDCEEWEAKKIREYAEKYDLKVEINYSDLASYKGDVSDVQILSIFINSKVNKEQLKRMPSLKLIVTRSTGFD
ncbi:MAG: hydroxyacid dehydrogenase, partial [Thermoprotei archaeon]